MAKYRGKAEIVGAFQVADDNITEIKKFLGPAFIEYEKDKGVLFYLYSYGKDGRTYVCTALARQKDFIFLNSNGIYGSLRPEDFNDRYELCGGMTDAEKVKALREAISHCCSICWAKDATDAAQCRLCGLKKALESTK